MKTVFVTLFLLFAITTFSQDATQAPSIQLTGTAEKKVVPDEIYISIYIRERETGRDKISIEVQEAQVQQAVKELGIPAENLSLSGATSNYVPLKWSKNDVISNSEYILKVTNARDVGYVFEKLDSLKIDNARIDRVDHSEIDQLRKEVRIMAIQAARDKADYLLEAIDQKRGKAIKVIENRVNMPVANTNANISFTQNFEQTSYESGAIDKRVGIFTEMTLSASVYVEFEIE